MAGHRVERLSHRIHEELAVLFERGMSDPRLVGVRILQVQVTGDLRIAKIYINATGHEETEMREIMEGLKHAASYLRRQLATSIDLRFAPELRFYADHSIARGERFLQVLDEIQAETKPKTPNVWEGENEPTNDSAGS